MASVTEIRAGLNDNIQTLGSLNTYKTVPEAPEPPCGIVLPASPFADIESMGRGIFSYHFRVLALVAFTVSDAAQDMLDGYLAPQGDGSLLAAIESDKTLGGAASDATVSQITAYGDVEWNELRYWGAELLVRVLATGT